MFVRKFCGVCCVALLALLCVGGAPAHADPAADCEEACIASEEACMSACEEGEAGDQCAEDCRLDADGCIEACEFGD